MKRYAYLIAGLVLIVAACQGKNIVLPAPEPAFSPAAKVVVTPLNIPEDDYEIIGQVEVSGKSSSDIKGLYNDLAQQCQTMGGDMVIKVQAGQGTEDRSEAYSLPRGYGESQYTTDYARPYGWGKGTVIRLKKEDKRNAYQQAQQQGDVGKACAVVGLPYP